MRCNLRHRATRPTARVTPPSQLPRRSIALDGRPGVRITRPQSRPNHTRCLTNTRPLFAALNTSPTITLRPPMVRGAVACGRDARVDRIASASSSCVSRTFPAMVSSDHAPSYERNTLANHTRPAAPPHKSQATPAGLVVGACAKRRLRRNHRTAFEAFALEQLAPRASARASRTVAGSRPRPPRPAPSSSRPRRRARRTAGGATRSPVSASTASSLTSAPRAPATTAAPRTARGAPPDTRARRTARRPPHPPQGPHTEAARAAAHGPPAAGATAPSPAPRPTHRRRRPTTTDRKAPRAPGPGEAPHARQRVRRRGKGHQTSRVGRRFGASSTMRRLMCAAAFVCGVSRRGRLMKVSPR